MIKLVIFDLDGTLLNTLDDLADSGNHILKQHHYPEHPTDAYRYFVGNGIKKLVERMLPKTVTDTKTIDALYNEFLIYYDQHKADKTSPYKGITELLSFLQDQKIKIAVASNKIHEAMDDLMAFYFPKIQFSAVFGQRKGIAPKPDPTIVYDILSQTGVSKEDTLYVGDTATDMLTAKNASLQSVGVLWGFRTEDELLSSGADHIIHSPKELITLLAE